MTHIGRGRPLITYGQVLCYIQDVETGDYTDFYYFKEVNTNVQANYDAQDVLGRAGQVKGYRNTSDRTMELVIEFWATNDAFSVQEQVEKKVTFLESFTHPNYGANGQFDTVKKPNLAVLVIGSFLRSRVRILGVSSNYDMSIVEIPTVYPYHATVTIQMEMVPARPLGRDDVIASRHLRTS